MDAWRAYDQRPALKLSTWSTWDFHPNVTVIAVVQQRVRTGDFLLSRREPFTCQAVHGHEAAEQYREWAEEEKNRRKAAVRWAASSSGQPLICLLPTAVTVHSILSLLDFDALMQLRVVSRTFKTLTEQAAVAWLNQRYPAGLRVARRRAEELQAKQLETAGAKGTKVTGRNKRKRSEGADEAGRAPKAPHQHQSEDSSSGLSLSAFSSSLETSVFFAEATAGAVRSHATAVFSASFSSSPLFSPPSSPSTAASYSVADAVWVMQELSWARALSINAKDQLTPTDIRVVAIVCKTDGLEHFCVDGEQWGKHFVSSAAVIHRVSGASRYDVMDIVDLVFSVHGSSAEVRSIRQLRKQRRAKLRRATEQRQRAVMEAMMAALAEANVPAKFRNGDSLFFQSGRVVQWRRGTWRSWPNLREKADESEVRLHAVMGILGTLKCALTGGCDWGGCHGTGLPLPSRL